MDGVANEQRIQPLDCRRLVTLRRGHEDASQLVTELPEGRHIVMRDLSVQMTTVRHQRAERVSVTEPVCVSFATVSSA